MKKKKTLCERQREIKRSSERVREKGIKSERLKKEGFGRREREMVRNSGFGQIMEEGDNPGFFKFLRREDLSCEIMRRIPHDCIKSTPDEEFSSKMTLKLPWGSSWPIKISKNPNFHYMEEFGWNKFVRENALGQNEYLTFTHEANMCFMVNIYQVDGTEMLRPRKSATIASSSGESRGGRLKQKRELKLGKKKKVDYEAGTSSFVPEFSLTIKKSYLHFLGIPKMYAEMHMPEETMMFKIRHPKGNKSWEVQYTVANARSTFSAGWAGLAKYLGLVVGHVCTFKLIKPTKMLLQVTTP